MVIYGKDGDANLIYYIEDFSGGASINWTEEGEYLTLEITITMLYSTTTSDLSARLRKKTSASAPMTSEALHQV